MYSPYRYTCTGREVYKCTRSIVCSSFESDHNSRLKRERWPKLELEQGFNTSAIKVDELGFTDAMFITDKFQQFLQQYQRDGVFKYMELLVPTRCEG